MAEIFVSQIDDLRDGSVVIVPAGDREIGVFRQGQQFYAYENLCVHQGGPVCEGMRIPKVEDVIAADKTLLGQRFVDDDMHIVCPWHGYEFKMKTGECVGDPKLRLRRFNVLTRDGNVYVVV
jgi:nitrite reductase/ring-hydroxylating ferredoxin subunit